MLDCARGDATAEHDGSTRQQFTELLEIARDVRELLRQALAVPKGPQDLQGQMIRALDVIFLAVGGWPAVEDSQKHAAGLQLVQAQQEAQLLAESRLVKAASIPGAPFTPVAGQ